jgi:ribosomal protein L11 methyltransferase
VSWYSEAVATWTAVEVIADAKLAEALESFLLDHGAPGLQSETVADGVRIVAHFADGPPLRELDVFVDSLRELLPGTARPRISVEPVTDDGWAENWKAHFPPLSIGERLYVRPPWVAAASGRVDIVLDPGMAFGTGHHSSTRGCLVLLERALAEHAGARVLDLGTGSGILAIAALKLGAGETWAVDIDTDACAVARDNAAVNQVGDALRVSDNLDAVPGAFDIVVANLLANLLVDFAATLSERLHPGGLVIGAGLLRDDAPAVRRAWRAAGLVDAGQQSDDEWMALAARRQT